MKRTLVGLASLVGVFGISVGAVAMATGGGHTPVTICHHAGPHPENWHTITVDDDSVTLNAHLAHGDTIGPCEGTPTETEPTETEPTETEPTETTPTETTPTTPPGTPTPIGPEPGTGAPPPEPGTGAPGDNPNEQKVTKFGAATPNDAPTAAAGTVEELPFTGADLGWVALAGFALMGAGAGVRLLARN